MNISNNIIRVVDKCGMLVRCFVFFILGFHLNIQEIFLDMRITFSIMLPVHRPSFANMECSFGKFSLDFK